MVAQLDKQYVQYGAGTVIRRMASYAFFEGRPHTTKGQWFNPVVRGILETCLRVPGVPVVDRPIYITGMGRSGTTLLGKLLSVHPQIGFLNEPKYMWALIDPRTDVSGDYVTDGGIFRLGEGDVVESKKIAARRLFGRYLKTVGAPRLLDKYPEMVFRVPYVGNIFPDAKFVFVTRNGIDAISSIAKWSEQKGRETKQHKEDWWGRNDVKWDYICDQLVTQDSQYEVLSTLRLADLGHIERGAIEWIVTMREGLQQEKANPGRLVRVSYERLLDKPDTELGRLMEACEISPNSKVIDYAARQVRPNAPKKPPSLPVSLRRLFDQTMELLDYR